MFCWFGIPVAFGTLRRRRARFTVSRNEKPPRGCCCLEGSVGARVRSRTFVRAEAWRGSIVKQAIRGFASAEERPRSRVIRTVAVVLLTAPRAQFQNPGGAVRRIRLVPFARAGPSGVPWRKAPSPGRRGRGEGVRGQRPRSQDERLPAPRTASYDTQDAGSGVSERLSQREVRAAGRTTAARRTGC